jgi:hypothetical protein
MGSSASLPVPVPKCHVFNKEEQQLFHKEFPDVEIMNLTLIGITMYCHHYEIFPYYYKYLTLSKRWERTINHYPSIHEDTGIPFSRFIEYQNIIQRKY